MTAIDLLSDPDNLRQMKDEFEDFQKGKYVDA